jgi:hypothetical protein
MNNTTLPMLHSVWVFVLTHHSDSPFFIDCAEIEPAMHSVFEKNVQMCFVFFNLDFCFACLHNHFVWFLDNLHRITYFGGYLGSHAEIP